MSISILRHAPGEAVLRLKHGFRPGVSNKKKGPAGPFSCWWRRRELNPRPLVLDYWLYMLRVRLLI